jgi:acyl-coenzyme A thioesterase PaaI-like protein
MSDKCFQDCFPDDVAICYGCGRNNPEGLQIKSYWEGDAGVCYFTPKHYHSAFPGVVYGGLIAALIDCHSICTAMAHAYREDNRELGTEPLIYFVTGELKVKYLKPTPMNTKLILQAHVTKQQSKKSYVHCSVFANNIETAVGTVLGIRVASYH